MIVPVFFVLLCSTIAESLFKGDKCTVTNGNPGICTFVEDCQVVYDELLAGGLPDTICGFHAQKVEPIICCPTNTVTTTTSVPTILLRDESDGRGAIAKQKCKEYSQYVWTVKYLPFGNRESLNFSQCAIKSIPLISGGTKADRMEFPHMAAVGYDLREGGIGWYCGGTLISESFVLSAAHCTYLKGSGHASWVRVGDLNLVRTDDGATPVDRRIIARIRHPDYKPPSQYHDIALLRLESPVTFNGWIRPACLHTEPSTGTQRAIATGWGRVNWIDAEGSNQLLKVTLSLIDSKTCHANWTSSLSEKQLPNGINADWSICASDEGRDTCQGDSGGPLVIFSDQEKYYCMYDVVGITSLGKFCGSNFPGIYTRVYNYIAWIESIVWI